MAIKCHANHPPLDIFQKILEGLEDLQQMQRGGQEAGGNIVVSRATRNQLDKGVKSMV